MFRDLPNTHHLSSFLFFMGNVKESLSQHRLMDLPEKLQLVPLIQVIKAVEKRLEIEISNTEPINEGNTCLVCKVHTKNGHNLILKIGLFSNVHSPAIDCLYSLIANANGLGALVPRPILLDLSGEHVEFPYYLMAATGDISLLKHMRLSNRFTQEKTIKSLGHLVRTLHSLRVNNTGYGEIIYKSIINNLSRQNYILEGKYSNVQEYLSNSIILLDDNHFKNILTYQEKLLYVNRLEMIRKPFNSVCLLHGDATPRNFIISRNKLTGVVDSTARLGWAIEDIATICIYLDMLE